MALALQSILAHWLHSYNPQESLSTYAELTRNPPLVSSLERIHQHFLHLPPDTHPEDRQATAHKVRIPILPSHSVFQFLPRTMRATADVFLGRRPHLPPFMRLLPAYGRSYSFPQVSSLRNSLTHLTSHLSSLTDRLAASQASLSSLQLAHDRASSAHVDELLTLRALCAVWEGRWREEKRGREDAEEKLALEQRKGKEDDGRRSLNGTRERKETEMRVLREQGASTLSHSSSEASLILLQQPDLDHLVLPLVDFRLLPPHPLHLSLPLVLILARVLALVPKPSRRARQKPRRSARVNVRYFCICLCSSRSKSGNIFGLWK